MYSYLKGKIAFKTPSKVVLEVHGVGFEAAITPSTFNTLPVQDEEILLYTSFVVRENAHTLYAFPSIEERNLFEALIDVSGVGPKMALSLTGHLSPEELFGAIVRQDIKLLSKVPGIGKKTAERMILDLKDKASGLVGNSPKAYQIPSQLDQETADALSALINLGYSPSIAEKALKKVQAETADKLALGELITQALRSITLHR